MKKTLLRSALIAIAGVGLMAGSAIADPVYGTALQSALNERTDGGVSGIDVNTDMILDGVDSKWSITGTTSSASTLFLELAAYASTNSFGIYDLSNINNKLELFSGSDDYLDPTLESQKAFLTLNPILNKYTAFDLTGYSASAIFGSGKEFGFYLEVGATGNIFYSDTNLNTDEQDHMFAYQGIGEDFDIFKSGTFLEWTPTEYVLAWEDLAGAYGLGSDRDFTDFVVMIESVKPVPEPATMLLFGTGLVGLAGFARRRKN